MPSFFYVSRSRNSPYKYSSLLDILHSLSLKPHSVALKLHSVVLYFFSPFYSLFRYPYHVSLRHSPLCRHPFPSFIYSYPSFRHPYRPFRFPTLHSVTLLIYLAAFTLDYITLARAHRCCLTYLFRVTLPLE